MSWREVCGLEELTPNRGVAALFGDKQVAVFHVVPGGEVLAVDNVDPFSDAAVLSRGIVGSVGETITIASPVYKQRFDLRTGLCVDNPDVRIATFPARVVEGRVQVDA